MEVTAPSQSVVDITVFGIVQGVGFRPFIYRLAKDLGYRGWVKNIGFGVAIHLEKKGASDFSDFLRRLTADQPPLSQIDSVSSAPGKFAHCRDFTIKKTAAGERFVFISPDISVCDNCLQEMKTPSDRRYRYPFINCTDCGPRYTIVQALPYDREQTTMQSFHMCPLCKKEYTNPLDRRYHAQPIACPDCGPQVELIEALNSRAVNNPIRSAARLIREGAVLAVKGLGGFHLICSPFSEKAVARLRAIKARRRKPLALMAKSTSIVQKYAHLNTGEKNMLESARRPVVLLKKKKDIPGIAPHLDELGFMLPYTPLHYLLLEHLDIIVATSSNKKDSPIMKEAKEGITDLCDYVLTHNRPIHMRADDSVMKVIDGKPLFLRRARGYVPYPQKVPAQLHVPHQLLALGGELKDTLSLYKNGYIVTSQFLGDLDEYSNYTYFEETLAHLRELFQVTPAYAVSDLHPDFHTTRYARRSGLQHIQVQHHFAHVLAPFLEHGCAPGKKALGVAFDGFGYGDDGRAWGGEFLLFGYAGYRRFAHFRYVPQPGGDLAAKQPWRMALAYLYDAFGRRIPEVGVFKAVPPNLVHGVLEMMEKNIRSPFSSSCGRLFDAISFLAGTAPPEVEFEAEAPMWLEAKIRQSCKSTYPFLLENSNSPIKISFRPTIRSLLRDIRRRIRTSTIAAKFHNTLAAVILSIAQAARDQEGIDTVVLAGGVFLNRFLTEKASFLLESHGFTVLRPEKYSPNDESISLGQIAHALAIIQGRKSPWS